MRGRISPFPRLLYAVTLAAVAASCGSRGAPVTPPATAGPPATSSSSAPPSTGPAPTTTTTRAGAPTTMAAPTAPPASPATVLTRGHTSARVVALTFDAGSDTGQAASILSFLEARSLRATFGITGQWAETNQALVRRMAADGDQVVNHTWDHRSFTGASTGTAPLSAVDQVKELSTTDQLLTRLTGRTTRPWFRPPYGDRNATVDTVVGAAGYRYELMWTVDTLGWKGVPAATVVQRCLAGAQPGEIILMHVGSGSTDHLALPSVVTGLQGLGYGFATVAQMAP